MLLRVEENEGEQQRAMGHVPSEEIDIRMLHRVENDKEKHQKP